MEGYRCDVGRRRFWTQWYLNSFFSPTNCNTQRSVEFRQLTCNVSNLAITLLLIHLTLRKFSLLSVKNIKLQKI